MRMLLRAICAALVLWLAAVPASATITSTSTKVVALGNGVTTLFNFSFVAAAPADIMVTYTDASGVSTVLAATQYTLTINPAASNTVWGVGGTVTYPLTGSPIATGTTLTIARSLPFTQTTPFANLGSVLPTAIESSLDKLTMQAQQLNTLFGGALVQPLTDAQAFAPLPAAAARANLALCFDATGYVPTACSTPASGTISSAMQSVVSAGSIAAGRTALGLGSAAQENLNGGSCGGASIQDDGSAGGANGVGFLRVVPGTVPDAVNQSVTCAFHFTQRFATGPLVYTLPRANTLFNGFGFWIYALPRTGVITIIVNANDNFVGSASGASVTVQAGVWTWVSTNAATFGTWVMRPSGQEPTRIILTSGSSLTYPTPANATQLRVRCLGGGGGGGGPSGSGSAGGFSSFGAFTCGGGNAGGAPTAAVGGGGGPGGSGGSGSAFRISGSAGAAGSWGSPGTVVLTGGQGGIGPFGGGSGPVVSSGTPSVPGANSGSGGSGGGTVAGGPLGAGGGGGSGEYAEIIITNPGTTFIYTVGTGGTGGAGGGGGSAGAPGAAGVIIIDEFYNFLLKRDVDPATNDNTPLFLNIAA